MWGELIRQRLTHLVCKTFKAYGHVRKVRNKAARLRPLCGRTLSAKTSPMLTGGDCHLAPPPQRPVGSMHARSTQRPHIQNKAKHEEATTRQRRDCLVTSTCSCAKQGTACTLSSVKPGQTRLSSPCFTATTRTQRQRHATKTLTEAAAPRNQNPHAAIEAHASLAQAGRGAGSTARAVQPKRSLDPSSHFAMGQGGRRCKPPQCGCGKACGRQSQSARQQNRQQNRPS